MSYWILSKKQLEDLKNPLDSIDKRKLFKVISRTFNTMRDAEGIQKRWDARKEKRFLRDNIKMKEGNLTKRRM